MKPIPSINSSAWKNKRVLDTARLDEFFDHTRSPLQHTMKEARLNGPSTVALFINNKKVGEKDSKATAYGAYTAHETLDIGRDEGMSVNGEYKDKGKFMFTKGQLHKVIFDIE